MLWLKPLNPPLTDWRGRRVWLVGASSGIGLALAQALHAGGACVVVSARQADLLHEFVVAHPGSLAVPLDVTEPGAAHAALAQIQAALPASHSAPLLDLVVYCAGTYSPLRATDWGERGGEHLRILHQHHAVNYQGALHVLDAVLPVLRAQGQGHVSLISSVAGWRGLPKSLAYGPTKAALTHLADILYLDLQPQGLGVSVIHPGFVATGLTAQNDFAMPSLMQPAQAAQAILRGWARGDRAIDFPKKFTGVLRLLRCLPDRVYFALMRRVTGL